MFYHNSSTILISHKDKINDLKKMSEPRFNFTWQFWKKVPVQVAVTTKAWAFKTKAQAK